MRSSSLCRPCARLCLAQCLFPPPIKVVLLSVCGVVSPFLSRMALPAARTTRSRRPPSYSPVPARCAQHPLVAPAPARTNMPSSSRHARNYPFPKRPTAPDASLGAWAELCPAEQSLSGTYTMAPQLPAPLAPTQGEPSVPLKSPPGRRARRPQRRPPRLCHRATHRQPWPSRHPQRRSCLARCRLSPPAPDRHWASLEQRRGRCNGRRRRPGRRPCLWLR